MKQMGIETALLLAGLSSLAATGCWRERREVYVEPRRDHYEHREYREERREDRHEGRHEDHGR